MSYHRGTPILLVLVVCSLVPQAPAWATPARPLFVVRVGVGGDAALLTVAPTPTLSGQATMHRLPLGLLSRDGHVLYVATPLYDQRSPSGTIHTSVRAIDPVSGRTLRIVTLVGSFTTRTGDYPTGALWAPLPVPSPTPPPTATAMPPPAVTPTFTVTVPSATGTTASTGSTVAPRPLRPMHVAGGGGEGEALDESQPFSALSFTGRWLVLREEGAFGASGTHIVVLDTATLRVTASLRLPGFFGVDAISADGLRLYLIEDLFQSRAARHLPLYAYQVRLYDLRAHALDRRPVRAAGESGTMAGVSWTRALSPDGAWLYTLYVQPGTSGAFVHALSLDGRLAYCLDLPDARTQQDVLAHYTLVAAPAQAALYLVNPVVGRVLVLRGRLPFAPPRAVGLGQRSDSPQRTLEGAVLSPDGRTEFVATAAGVWVLDTVSLAVRATYARGEHIASVALSRDGAQVYALDAGHATVTLLDAGTGTVLGRVPVPPGSWAITQVLP